MFKEVLFVSQRLREQSELKSDSCQLKSFVYLGSDQMRGCLKRIMKSVSLSRTKWHKTFIKFSNVHITVHIQNFCFQIMTKPLTKSKYWTTNNNSIPNMDRISSFIPPAESKRSSGRHGSFGHQAEKDVHIYEVIEEVKSRYNLNFIIFFLQGLYLFFG